MKAISIIFLVSLNIKLVVSDRLSMMDYSTETIRGIVKDEYELDFAIECSLILSLLFIQ